MTPAQRAVLEHVAKRGRAVLPVKLCEMVVGMSQPVRPATVRRLVELGFLADVETAYEHYNRAFAITDTGRAALARVRSSDA